MGSALLRALALSALVIGPFLSPATAGAAISSGSGGWDDRGAATFDGTRTVFDCQPGLATAPDRIAVYQLSGVDTAGDPRAQLAGTEAVGLSAAVQNRGDADAPAVRLTFLARRHRAARVDGINGVLAVQDVPASLPIGAAVLLVIAAVLAATIASRLWGQTRSATGDPDGVKQGYFLQPFRPLAIMVGAVDVPGGETKAMESVVLSAAVHNRGHADAHAVRVTFLVGRDRGTMEPVGTAVVDVPGDAAVRARLTWIPPAGGDWLMQARVDGIDVAGPTTTARASAAADVDPAALLATHDDTASLPIGATVLLVIGAVLAAAIGSRLSRQKRSATEDPDEGASDA